MGTFCVYWFRPCICHSLFPVWSSSTSFFLITVWDLHQYSANSLDCFWFSKILSKASLDTLDTPCCVIVVFKIIWLIPYPYLFTENVIFLIVWFGLVFFKCSFPIVLTLLKVEERLKIIPPNYSLVIIVKLNVGRMVG